MMRCRSRMGAISVLVVTTLIAPAVATAVNGSPEVVRRVLTMLDAAAADYREGVRDGTVVRPIELEEAKSFIEEAQQRVEHLELDARATDELRNALNAVHAALDRAEPAERVTDTLAGIRARLASATGVSATVDPPVVPSAARGQALFAENCVSCHGEHADGKGAKAAQLNPPPANFTDPEFMRAETPDDFFHVISLGKRNTGMPSWDGVLAVQDRWDLIAYLWTLAPGPQRLAEGQGVYLTQCANCHGAAAEGHGPFAGVLIKPVPDLSRPPALVQQTDAELFAATTHGVGGTPMPAFAQQLNADDRWKAVAFLRLLSLGGTLPTAGSPGGSPGDSLGNGAASSSKDLEAALTESLRLVDLALVAYDRGDAGAAGNVADAYLEFESVEKRLGAAAPDLKTTVEDHFMQLRQGLRIPNNAPTMRAAAELIRSDFAAVRTALQPHTSPYALFVESATIILREGFEMVLVIGALLAYVIKTGNTGMRRPIYAGTAVGVIASFATAAVMGELLRMHPSSSDLLEGATMLLAAVVLFWVSYWLISKAEADKWQRYIRGKVQSAVSSRRTLGLAGAAFLAVYREGFETVLFYQALYASAATQSVAVTGGFVAGAVVLAIVYLGLRRFEVRIPIQQFFFVTGLLLYGMAAVFAGQGVHELQDAGVISMTAVGWMPALPLLGVFPSIESLGTQAVFVALLVYATGITLRRRRAADVAGRPDLATEVRALSAVVEAMRQELARLQTGGTPDVGVIETQVSGVLLQVERVAGQIGGAGGVRLVNADRPRTGH